MYAVGVAKGALDKSTRQIKNTQSEDFMERFNAQTSNVNH